MRLWFLTLGLTAALGACGKAENDQQATAPPPRNCTAAEAHDAVSRKLTPILKTIENPKTRDQGCARLDDIIRYGEGSAFDEFKPKDCEWSADANTTDAFREIAEPKGDHLAELCDWARKDAQRRGAAILDAMPPEDRQAVEDAYNGY